MSTDSYSESYIPVRWILPSDPSGSSMCGKVGRVLATNVLTVNDVEVVPGAIHIEVIAGDVLTVCGKAGVAVVLGSRGEKRRLDPECGAGAEGGDCKRRKCKCTEFLIMSVTSTMISQ